MSKLIFKVVKVHIFENKDGSLVAEIHRVGKRFMLYVCEINGEPEVKVYETYDDAVKAAKRFVS